MSSTDTSSLGAVRGTALYVAAVLGPGILTLPALAAATAGPAFLLALVALLLLSVPLAHGFAGLGAGPGDPDRVDRSLPGHIGAAFGPRAGSVAAALFYVGVPPGVGALALFGAGYLAALGSWVPPAPLVAAGLVVLVWGLNARGLRASATTQVVLTGLLVLLVGVLVVGSAPHFSSAHLHPVAPHGWGALLPATFLLVWVATGWEASANFASSLQPRVRRRVVWSALGIVASAFLGVSVTLVGVLGTDDLGGAPVATLLHRTLGPVALVVGVVLAVVLTVGNMSSYTASLGSLGATLPALDRVPGGPLTVPSLIALGSIAATAGHPGADGAATTLVGITAASQVPVLLLGAAAAARTTTGWARVSATIATGGVGLLLVPAAPHLWAPALIALGVALVQVRNLRDPRRVVAPGSCAPCG